MTHQKVAGVDWARGEWLAVIFEDGIYSGCLLENNFEMLWKRVPDLNRMLIDVPIGLPDDEETLQDREELDSLARAVTGRPSSVFPVPSREACTKANDGEPYDRVNETNQDVLGKGLSRQSYHIASGIGEVDAFLQSNASITNIVTESHPEVCFRGLRGEELQHSKKTAAGVGERLDSLDNHLDVPGDVFQTLCARLTKSENRATVDDVIDALGLAVTAWKSGEKPDTLPKNPNIDSKGLPMQMAYWSESTLA
ncbi:DUF429 domain-containing protein [Halorubrum pallidum]|uniref:DUF429 domain-containing protein n=1 Tax=Halorubrum pallidum TaxID=1526114 RepID=A0ABD5T0S1_9EURY